VGGNMFVSVGVRFEANVEALNMVETTGNYTKHRRVPYIFRDEEGYKIIYVPAISGESLAHAYQELLVGESKSIYSSPPVCSDCMRGEFFKSMDKIHLKSKTQEDPSKLTPEKLEKIIVEKCLVEDIGGFLYAERPPLKRSSAFQVSYALPIKTVAIYSTTEPQLHARHAQLRLEEIEKKGRERGRAAPQMIYYVETGSALYGFTFNIDLDAIGISGINSKPILVEEEIKKRRKVALMALLRLVSSQQFGAKLSRFFPVGGILSVVASVSKNPFSITSPIYDGYINSTSNRLSVLKSKFKEDVYLYIFDKTENIESALQLDFVEKFDTPEEPILKVIEIMEEMKII